MDFVRRQAWLYECLLPLLVASLVALYAARAGWDEACTRAVWQAGDSSWRLGEATWAQIVYHYGPVPAVLLGIGALIGWSASYLRPRWCRLRAPALFVVLMVALGPGLLINGLLKPGWGRPRPRQLAEFGGEASYLPPWQPGHRLNDAPSGKSFPSGHASMGFALMAPFFLCARRRPGARVGLALGLAAGLLIGAARICQGGHFLSDILFSGILVYATGWGLARILLWQRADQTRPALVLRPVLRPDSVAS